MRKYVSTKPEDITPEFQRIMDFIIFSYLQCFFYFKRHWDFTNGAKNFHYMIETFRQGFPFNFEPSIENDPSEIFAKLFAVCKQETSVTLIDLLDFALLTKHV